MDLHLWSGARAMTLETAVTAKTVIITAHLHTIITIIVITGLHLGTSVTSTAAGLPSRTARTTATGPPPMTEDDGHTCNTGLHLGSRDHHPGTVMINKIGTSKVTLVNVAMLDGKTK